MIRVATYNDVATLVEMGQAMVAESPRYRDKKLNVKILTAFMYGMLDNPHQYCLFVAEKGSEITGMLGGMICPYFFTLDDFYSCDLFHYVRPERRGSVAFVRLVKAYERWAGENGISPENITLGVSAGIGNIENFYNRLGYNCVGKLYQKDGRMPFCYSRKEA